MKFGPSQWGEGTAGDI